MSVTMQPVILAKVKKHKIEIDVMLNDLIFIRKIYDLYVISCG